MEHALILGGTRGIGRGIAARCLERGMTVTVCGRHPDALNGHPLRSHPRLRVVALDMTEVAEVHRVVSEAGLPGEPLALLVVTAGLYFNSRNHRLDEASTMQMLGTNVTGLASALDAGAQRMLQQGFGRMAAISSMAGLLKDYPGASVYAATKRSVLSLCETYRKALAPFGIPVTAIVPGYVDTDRLRALNQGDARHKPFLMSEDDAVERILRAIDRGSAVSAFPWQMRAIVGLLNLVPGLQRVPEFTLPASAHGPAARRRD